MKVEKVSLDFISVVALTKPVDIQKISIDAVKAKTMFATAIALPDRLLFTNQIPSGVQISVEPTRWEFNSTSDGNYTSGLLSRAIAEMCQALDGLGEVITAFGTNYLVRFSVDGAEDAGAKIRDLFLKDSERVESVIGAKVISSATRIVWGDASNYSDLKIHPIELGASLFGAHLHVHSEFSGTARVFSEKAVSKFASEIESLNRVLAGL